MKNNQKILILRSAGFHLLNELLDYLSKRNVASDLLSDKDFDSKDIINIFVDLKIENGFVSTPNKALYSTYDIIILLIDFDRYTLESYKKFIKFAKVLNPSKDILIFTGKNKLSKLKYINVKYFFLKLNRSLNNLISNLNILYYFYKRLNPKSIAFFLNIFNKLFRLRFILLFDQRIGHFLGNTEVYLRRKTNEKWKERSVFIYDNPCNKQYIKMLKRKHFVIKSSFLKDYIRKHHQNINYKKFIHSFEHPRLDEAFHTSYKYNIGNMKPSLYFSENEKDEGYNLLSDMGLSKNDWYICFHSRDNVYLKKNYKKSSGERFNYHNFRDCNINNFLKAARYIENRGGYSLRMGQYINDHISLTKKIIDYAGKYRTDFGDVFIPAHAKFFLGNTAGLINASSIQNVPVAAANFIPMEYALRGESDIYIPKKIWSADNKRFLTFKEILESGIGRYEYKELYEKDRLEVVENNEDEILDLCIEMNERLDKTWQETEEDIELQNRFRSLFKPKHYCYGFKSKICANFLKKNLFLLNE